MIKNKNVLVLTSSWKPNYTMNGIVIKNLVEVLREDNDIYIVSFRQADDDDEMFDGKKIKYVYGHPYRLRKARNAEKLHQNKGIIKRIYRIKTNIIRSISSLCRIISPIGINYEMCRKYLKALEEMLSNYHIDYVLALGEPYETYYGIDKIHSRYPNIKYVIYQVDRFASSEVKGPTLCPYKLRNWNRKRMLERISKFARICIVNYAYSIERSVLKNADEIHEIGQPLVKKRNGGSIINREDTFINMVYAGSLYKNARPVRGCLDVLDKLTNYGKYRVHFYHRGDCGDDILLASQKNKDGIIDHGSVGADEAYLATESADVLFCISTVKGNYISGKTFEYISTGKPIVFFYHNEEDLSLSYFKEYRHIIFIKLDDNMVDENADRISKFINKTLGSRVPFDEIERIFAFDTPKGVVETLFPSGGQ